VVHPEYSSLPIGGNVTITCKAYIPGTLVYMWERKEGSVWITVGGYNSTTYTTSNHGLYRCIVNNGTKTVSQSVYVAVQKLLRITVQPKNGFIKRGEFYTFTCNASGSGMLIYSWERKIGQRWLTVSRYKASHNTSTLGRYRCRVTNEVESIVSKAVFIKYYSKCPQDQ